MIGFEIDMSDHAGPKMERIAKEMPHLIDKALRITVARHRRRLMKFIKDNEAGYRQKKPLNSEGIKKLNRATANPEIKRRHIHRSLAPFSGEDGRSVADATRYRRLGRFVYGYGFIGGAEKWAELLAQGLFQDPKTKAVGNGVTQPMRDYFDSIGLGLAKNKTTLDYPARPVVKDYFQRNKLKMLRDFNSFLFGYYNRATGKSKKVVYSKVRFKTGVNIA